MTEITNDQNQVGYCLFPTNIGECGLSWTKRGILGLQLPEKTKSLTEKRLMAKIPAKYRENVSEASLQGLPAGIKMAVSKVTRLLAGEKVDLSDIKIDERPFSPFFKKVYAVTQKIPAGKTKSYGELSILAGSPKAARAVGQAMARNPVPLIIPCHRVLSSTCDLVGFSAYGGVNLKKRLLNIESAKL